MQCANGGLLYPCDYCIHVVCSDCVVMPESYVDGMKFTCFGCHLIDSETGLRKKPSPYLGLEGHLQPLDVKAPRDL
ncbi:hypothetical protein BDZ94DRAFT_191146 [Collybia nuda]|uniref:Uncharacterized protein n=1 Tax=Collybia nuda TaxID=64659 RepID=A0A9P5XW91_9AGAR|nr:hypothetical protein BDZ94DRAFT_191146 [Collybia nuda]